MTRFSGSVPTGRLRRRVSDTTAELTRWRAATAGDPFDGALVGNST
jgi:hypothetical protein